MLVDHLANLQRQLCVEERAVREISRHNVTFGGMAPAIWFSLVGVIVYPLDSPGVSTTKNRLQTTGRKQIKDTHDIEYEVDWPYQSQQHFISTAIWAVALSWMMLPDHPLLDRLPEVWGLGCLRSLTILEEFTPQPYEPINSISPIGLELELLRRPP